MHCNFARPVDPSQPSVLAAILEDLIGFCFSKTNKTEHLCLEVKLGTITSL